MPAVPQLYKVNTSKAPPYHGDKETAVEDSWQPQAAAAAQPFHGSKGSLVPLQFPPFQLP